MRSIMQKSSAPEFQEKFEQTFPDASFVLDAECVGLPKYSAMPDLTGMQREDLADMLLSAGVPKPLVARRATQIRTWVFRRGLTSFKTMTGLPASLRSQLAGRLTIGRPAISRCLVSLDGTRKYLLRLADGQEIEAVFIPDEDRGTLCVSSQVGCTLTCSFCHTGTQRLVRNLSAAEIVGQVLAARDDLDDWEDPRKRSRRRITNLVLMGMGEPLLNPDAVVQAMRIVRDDEGIGLSRRRITLSTSGIVPGIQRAGREIGCMLAVSLHATTDELRDHLVPINRKYPITELLDACRAYPRLSNAERILFEYVMLKDLNDSPGDAHRLVRLIDGIPAKINLIPFNPWPGSPYQCSDPARIDRFARIVNDAGYSSPVRTPRGTDIMAACGQLRTKSLHPKTPVLAKRTANRVLGQC